MTSRPPPLLKRWLPPAPSATGAPLLVYFDGVCNLCNGFVDFLMRTDAAGALRYASLQGETARAAGIVMPDGAEASIIVDDGATRWRESDAVLRIAAALGGGWRVLAALLHPLPRALRNAVYRGVAKNRYRLFGKRDTCRLPTPAERARFLP